MQIMNVPCKIAHNGQNQVNYNRDVNYAVETRIGSGNLSGFPSIIRIFMLFMPKFQGTFIICIILSSTQSLVPTARDTLAIRSIAVDKLARRVATSSLSWSTAVKHGVPCKNLLRRCWSYANLESKNRLQASQIYARMRLSLPCIVARLRSKEKRLEFRTSSGHQQNKSLTSGRPKSTPTQLFATSRFCYCWIEMWSGSISDGIQIDRSMFVDWNLRNCKKKRNHA